MREIKFRAWDGIKMLDNPKFEFFNHGKNGRAVMMANEDENVEIMQYTGLKDKNGKEIFEGDIVRNKLGSIGPVVFAPGSFRFDIKEGTNLFSFCSGYERDRHDIEVIGNIYGNSELLTN